MGRCPSLGLLIIADGIYDRIRTKSDGVDLSDGSVDCALVPHDRSNYPTTQASYFSVGFCWQARSNEHAAWSPRQIVIPFKRPNAAQSCGSAIK